MIHPILKELIYSGRTFDVHRAKDGVDMKNVIVKQANSRADRVDAAARITNEFSISRSIHCTSVITADKWLDTTQGPMLVFPENNLSALNMYAPLPLAAEELLALALKMAESLQTIHEAGIVHRDINPSNFVVSSDLSDVRLIDFCIAMPAGTLVPQRQVMGTLHGTLNYMPPEQSGRIDRRLINVQIFTHLAFHCTNLLQANCRLSKTNQQPYYTDISLKYHLQLMSSIQRFQFTFPMQLHV